MAPKARGASIDERVRTMALRFAEDLTRAVRQGLAEEVTEQVTAVLNDATRGGILRAHLGGGPGDRRIGKKPVPVRCPAPGCENAGIRAKRNFCADHATALSEAEKRRLRDEQTDRPARRASTRK